MGKMALILTMGMSVIIAFFVLRLNANAKEGLSTTVNMFQNTQARLIANSGVEVYLEKMRRDKTLNSGTFLNNKMLDGTYDIEIKPGTNDSVTIKSTAYYMDVTHTTIVKAQRSPVTFPSLLLQQQFTCLLQLFKMLNSMAIFWLAVIIMIKMVKIQ